MASIKVIGGTPCLADTLCRTCRHALIIKGFSISQEEFNCAYFFRERRITFAVNECSMYEDKRLASKKEMDEIAWFLTTRTSGRSVGFISAAQFQKLKEQCTEELPVNHKTTQQAE